MKTNTSYKWVFEVIQALAFFALSVIAWREQSDSLKWFWLMLGFGVYTTIRAIYYYKKRHKNT